MISPLPAEACFLLTSLLTTRAFGNIAGNPTLPAALHLNLGPLMPMLKWLSKPPGLWHPDSKQKIVSL